ncbi:MAG: 1,2-phenylacetyl-CoA epoxidase subunit PaaC [Shimia sp.]
MGDTTLVLGHRTSEWCGHGPALEDDIALANVALDLIGQAKLWLDLAAEVEGAGRSADDLAMLRDAWDFRCALLVQLPNGDFGQTIMRQCLFDAWHLDWLTRLSTHPEPRIAEIATRAAREATYHLERSSQTVIALGDGTDESHRRMQTALDRLWPYVGELFEWPGESPAPDRTAFDRRLAQIAAEATLTLPAFAFAHTGGFTGRRHTEHLGHMLGTMQWLQRAYPGASW